MVKWKIYLVNGYGSSRKPCLFGMIPVVQIEYVQWEFSPIGIQHKPLQSQIFLCRFWAIFPKNAEWWFFVQNAGGGVEHQCHICDVQLVGDAEGDISAVSNICKEKCITLHQVAVYCTELYCNVLQQSTLKFAVLQGTRCTKVDQLSFLSLDQVALYCFKLYQLQAMAQVVQDITLNCIKSHCTTAKYCSLIRKLIKIVALQATKMHEEDQLPFGPPGMYHLTKVIKDIYNQNWCLIWKHFLFHLEAKLSRQSWWGLQFICKRLCICICICNLPVFAVPFCGWGLSVCKRMTKWQQYIKIWIWKYIEIHLKKSMEI